MINQINGNEEHLIEGIRETDMKYERNICNNLKHCHEHFDVNLQRTDVI